MAELGAVEDWMQTRATVALVAMAEDDIATAQRILDELAADDRSESVFGGAISQLCGRAELLLAQGRAGRQVAVDDQLAQDVGDALGGAAAVDAKARLLAQRPEHRAPFVGGRPRNACAEGMRTGGRLGTRRPVAAAARGQHRHDLAGGEFAGALRRQRLAVDEVRAAGSR